MTRSDEDEAEQFWDHHHHVAEDPGFWMAHASCRRAINRRVGGDPNVWPLRALSRDLERSFRLGLSLGCGLGSLEREVRRLNLCDQIEGIDVSEASLREARDRAREEGLSGITYRCADLNTLRLPRRRYDIVFFHQSLHHVRSVEKLLARVERSLKPDGVFFIDEWTGPSRREWTDARLARLRKMYAGLPESWRRFPTLQKPVEIYDPSEAIRSSAILPSVRRLFDVSVEKPYGGHLVSVLLPQLERTRIPAEELDALVELWLEMEDQDLARDPSLSYHAAVVARPRRGLSGLISQTANLGIRVGMAARYRIPTAWRILTGRHQPPNALPPEARTW